MNCSICNNILETTTTSSSIIEINSTRTTHTNIYLMHFIQKTLNCDLIRSKYICTECFDILMELDSIEQSCINLKKQIFKRFIYFDKENTFLKDASSQTENNININNTDVIETIKKESDDLLDTKELKIHSEENNDIREKKLKPFECSICHKRFVSKNGMIIHERKHQNQYQTLNKEDTIKLESLVEGDVNFDDETTKSENCLENETDIEKQLNHFSNNCNTKKKTKKKKISNPIKPLKYSCPQCPKMWRTMGELRSHISSHSTLRPYICEVCGQAYKHKSALDIHVGMHNGINPFSCEFCHKSFTQKGALQRHLPIHTGEAPYQCDLCGKRFVHHTSFNMHTLAHTGQKSYKCSTCGLALLSGSHLKRHMRVHTGEKKYACTQCGKRFAERYNLAAHQRLHEAGPSSLSKRLYRCQVCGAVFERKPKLEEHLSNNHNKISESDPSRKWSGVGHFLSNANYSEDNFNTETTTAI